MAFNWDLRVPFRYGDNHLTLRAMEKWLLQHHHPAYVRRLIAWLHYKDGKVGVGGGWRAGGAQPDKPGFAPEGRSFHQDQRFADGFLGAAAVDLVYQDGPDPGDNHDGIAWREVPIQGSVEARKWGIHANVGVPGNGESWHIQPVEIDGWGSATGNGTHAAPAIDPNYPIPAEHNPYSDTPNPEPTEGPMRTLRLRLVDSNGTLYDDQVYAVTLGNVETLKKLGIADAPLIGAQLDATREQIEAELGFRLTPSD